MAEPATLARPYAEAVFELARQSGALDKWSEILARLAGAAVHPSIGPLIGNPRITNAQLVDVFMSAGGEEIAGTRNLVATLAENGRLPVLPEVYELFEELKNESQGVVEADIATAFPLGGADLEDVVNGLERRFKRKVHANVQIDQSLIGGVRVRVGDEVIDNSVRAKLAAMSATLAAR